MIRYAYQSGRPTYMLNHYVLDTEDEIQSLTTKCAMGSQASVVESGNTYMLNSSKEWILQPAKGSGSTGGSGGSSSDTGIVELDPTTEESGIAIIDNSPSFNDEIVMI